MEVSEAISVQPNPTELGFHQPPLANNVDSDHKTSGHRHGEEGGVGGHAVEIGLPRPRASSNGDSDSATSDLALSEQIASLDLEENDGSPKADSEVKTEATEEEIEIRSESDHREDSIAKEGEEEESIWKDSSGEQIGNGEAAEDEKVGLKEFEVFNGGDQLETRDEKFNARKCIHPLRPEAEDCAFYLKTGNCKFGSHCKFNHPVRKKPNHQAAKERIKEKEKEKEKQELPEKSGRPDCKFYLRSGGCKHGKSCRYNHPRAKPTQSAAPVIEFNFVGLPIRMGEKECPYYMRTGVCKYGVHCRYHHPDPTDAAAGSETTIEYGNGGSQLNMSISWLSPTSVNEVSHSSHAQFVPTMNVPTQRALSPNSEWNGYQAPVYPPPERNMPPPPCYSMNKMTTEIVVDDYPERPDQPTCSYFMKTGVCKYRFNCKYHHPKPRGSTKTTTFTLSDKGLPLRPDQVMCSHYSRYGLCKYGPACKYDHSQANLSSGGDNDHAHGHSESMEDLE